LGKRDWLVTRPQPIDKQGWLSKTGGTIKTVKRRWFVLRGTLLSYFQTEQDKQRT